MTEHQTPWSNAKSDSQIEDWTRQQAETSSRLVDDLRKHGGKLDYNRCTTCAMRYEWFIAHVPLQWILAVTADRPYSLIDKHSRSRDQRFFGNFSHRPQPI